MEIQSNLTVLNATAQRAVANLLLQFKVGQIVPATVVRTLPDTGQAQLNIGGNLVKAQSTLPLTPGQTLQLEVLESGNLPKLKILGTTLNPALDGSARENAVFKNIGLQKSPVLLPKQLLAFAKTTPGIDALPARVRNLAQNILTNLPDLQDLSTSRGIKQAIGESGIFLEARLAAIAKNGPESLDHDLKANLLRFAARADTGSTSGEIEKQQTNDPSANASRTESDSQISRTLTDSARGALSRIVLDQIASLPDDQPGKQVWNLEIPFQHAGKAESARLTIERDGRAGADATEHQWSIVVELNLPNLGTLQSKISLSGERVHAYFRTESNAIRELIQSNFDILDTQFGKAGLTTGNLASGTGVASRKPTQSAERSLLDERV